MSPPHIIPVVLCGGRGARLWPLSSPDKPKVFHCLVGQHSLFQDTLLRCRSAEFAERPIVVGSAMHQTLIADQLAEIGVAADILLEPYGRDSLAAALAGALLAHKRNPESIILLLASDHHIPDVQAFVKSVVMALDLVEDRDGVVFGVGPDEPSGAFGYIKPGVQLAGGGGFELSHFKEKPTRVMAQSLIAEGWLWNSGNFLCKADRLLASARRLVPEALTLVGKALLSHQTKDCAKILDAACFSDLKAQSFDHAILERLTLAAVLPVGYKWRDLGSWDAIIALEAENHPTRSTDVNHNCS